jgi:hypothetical protein
MLLLLLLLPLLVATAAILLVLVLVRVPVPVPVPVRVQVRVLVLVRLEIPSKERGKGERKGKREPTAQVTAPTAESMVGPPTMAIRPLPRMISLLLLQRCQHKVATLTLTLSCEYQALPTALLYGARF